MILPLGFASGLPRLLVYSTLSAWLATDQINIKLIGAFALASTPYALKFLWSPLVDRLPPPLPLGRRRGWGIAIQIALIASILVLGAQNPARHLALMAGFSLLVSFLSASQDIVIDAYRVEILDDDRQGPGAGLVQAGYRIAMLAAGAGSLIIAARFGWFAAYAVMAAGLVVGILTFLFGPEPPVPAEAAEKTGGVIAWIKSAVGGPFRDFMARPAWPAILLAIIGYKLGEAMAGAMAQPLYIHLGFTLDEIAAVSKLFGFFATLAGGMLGAIVATRFGIMRSLLACGLLQSFGNLAYVFQADAGHDLQALALCVFTENLTGGMAGAALVAYLSSLCNLEFTATQYALLSSVSSVGITFVASSGGVLVAGMGWANFFFLTTIVTLPALGLVLWLMRREAGPARAQPAE